MAAKKYYNAHECSGIIHTDIQKDLSGLRLVSYDDYIRCGSEQASKTNGMEARGQRLHCQ